MRKLATLLLGACLLALCLTRPAAAQGSREPFVRLAELDVVASQLDEFTAAAKLHLQAALATEPGILALHAVTLKDEPTRVRVLEVYADVEAYRTHLETPHFKQFVADTRHMIVERKLLDTVPVRLGSKARLTGRPIARVADLRIDPAQLPAYIAAVTEEIEASLDVEPGVLTLYCMALKDQPNELRFFEIYADEAAYRAHVSSPHFLKYVAVTKPMITARALYETLPIGLDLKPQ
jgi:quinol monooxygenase YgiN